MTNTNDANAHLTFLQAGTLKLGDLTSALASFSKFKETYEITRELLNSIREQLDEQAYRLEAIRDHIKAQELGGGTGGAAIGY